jgi:hypothetical protein
MADNVNMTSFINTLSNEFVKKESINSIGVEDTMKQLEGLGFERMGVQDGSSFLDSSTVIIIPTRGQIDQKVVSSWISMIAPMNQKRAIFFARGMEVGQAYDTMVENILKDPNLNTWKYILTLEDDNIQPSDAHIRLLESIRTGPFDAVGGLYFTKGDFNMPMCYGSPEIYQNTSYLEFIPRDVNSLMKGGATVVECNGLAMGCTLYSMEVFKKIPKPWFQTIADVVSDKITGNTGVQVMTQDLYFSKKMKEAGMRLACDIRVKVGHLDATTGMVY